MKPVRLGLYSSGRPTDSRRHCPLCGATLVRTPRRLIDRLFSRFMPMLRYRCERFLCQWQGNMRLGPMEEASDTITSLPSRGS